VQEKEIDWSANLARHFKKILHTLINFGPQLRSQGEFMMFNFVRLFSGLVFSPPYRQHSHKQMM
jgi:hypothetical protein